MGGIAAFESRLVIEAAPLGAIHCFSGVPAAGEQPSTIGDIVAAEPHTRLVRGRRADMKSRELIATSSGDAGQFLVLELSFDSRLIDNRPYLPNLLSGIRRRHSQ